MGVLRNLSSIIVAYVRIECSNQHKRVFQMSCDVVLISLSPVTHLSVKERHESERSLTL